MDADDGPMNDKPIPDGPFDASRVRGVANDIGELLYNVAMGVAPITPWALKAAEIMLKKTQPDLTQSTVKVTLAELLTQLGEGADGSGGSNQA